MQQPKVLERLVQWAVELGEHDIRHKHRIIIKGQATADFRAEFIGTQFKGARISEAIIQT